MEKVVYALTAPEGSDPGRLGADLLHQAAPALVAGGACGVQVNVVDDAVAPASPLRFTNSEVPADAVVSVWVNSATEHLRQWADDLLAPHVGSLAAYLVTESVPLPNQRFPCADGSRTEGFSQIAFLHRPETLPPDEWRAIWLDSHTQVALDTQDTFLYVQNVVVRPLTLGAPPWDGIVEECFPTAAMTDPHAFFAAPGDADLLREHQTAMLDSCGRFLDVATLDVVPTSRYVVRTPTG